MPKPKIKVPVDLLESLVDGDECDFDHHGGCQAHGYLSLEPHEECPQHELKRRLAKYQAEQQEAQEPVDA